MAYELTFETIDASTCKVTGYTGTPVDVVISAEYGGRTVVELGYACFLNTTTLETITIPDTVTVFGDFCFFGCTSLEEIILPSSLIEMGQFCFASCDSLTSIEIPNTVTSLGGACFSNCPLLASVILSSSISTLPDSCFNDCESLTTIIIPNSVTAIGGFVFFGCESLTTIDIPNSVLDIGDSCFRRCSMLSSVVLPNAITSLGNSLFNECHALVSINIPKSVTILGARCFHSCYNLSEVTIPASVTSIEDFCFFNCYYTAFVMRGNAPTLGASAFDISPTVVYYPSTATGYTNPWGGRPTVAYVVGSLVGFGSFSGSITMGNPSWAVLDETEVVDSVESTATWPPADFGGGATTDLGQTITLDLQGGTGETTHYTFETTYGEFPTITRFAYLFSGWFTAPYGEGTRVYSDSYLADPEEDETLYAKWIQYQAGKVSCGKSMLSHFAVGIGTDLFVASIDARLVRSNPTQVVLPIPAGGSDGT